MNIFLTFSCKSFRCFSTLDFVGYCNPVITTSQAGQDYN